MADSEFEEFRRVFDRIPQHTKAPTPFYSLVPNVGLEDESPSSKSDGTPEDDRGCVADNDSIPTLPPGTASPGPPPEPPEAHRSPRHQTFVNGERRRRKLPEIPKNRKSTILTCGQPASLADELGALAGPLIRPGCQGRPLLVLKCGYLLDEDSSPDSERLQSLGDVDSGHSTAHSPIDTGPKSLSPTPLQQNETNISVSPSSSCSISGINFAGNMTTVPHSQLEMLEATHRGLHKFNPRHHDEIEVEIGDPIYVQKEAEDLWCEGVNLRTGQQGIFPSAYAVDMDYNDFDPANAKVKRERYLLGYMGSVETLAHKGTGVVCQAVKKIVGECSGEPRAQSCILEVSDQGLRMVDRSKPERGRNAPCIDYFYSLKNVSFCAFHPRDHRYLGFITKHPTLQRFACHVFRGQESTRPVAEAVGRAFQRFYQKFIETAYPIEDIYIE
ncbi:JNK-interacting protein 1 [Leguminivora glycinivorella]|uniref:JNK-interacting protein 1 n=1 Tax=Leguminivora glycinivorella TaxID=1035111 RepID=UPI00200ED795|nr:JNK-interacting protein 1 [Leguminivora glycinivorella]